MPGARTSLSWVIMWPKISLLVLLFAVPSLNATCLPETEAYAGPTRVELERHAAVLRKRLPGPSFSVVVQPPFVVIGDESAAMVRKRASGTVQWAVDELKRAYFKKDPADIIDVWLFDGKESYERNARKLFGETPSTPYGYYSAANKALVMNIATGGGTLIHEIVHPFMSANFPECPPWLNEGMGSLYEQCGEKNGRISGLTNWRLPGLQDAIRAGKVPSFEKLLAMDNTAFYNHDRGTNYAESRYICYYLQEKGLLQKFYRDFTAKYKSDPGGIKTLKEVLRDSDLAAFKNRWETFVLGLSFP